MATLSPTSPLQTILNCFILRGVQERDIQLGIGAYGRVFEVQYAGKCCAAKETHSIFFSVSQPEELERIKSNFLQECSIWSTLHHPNIVTLIGVYFRDNDSIGMPIMVMEKMECSLYSLIKKQNDAVVKIDLRMKLSILHDVAVGLWHLHNQEPPIIHRDLTPNNILIRQGTRGGAHCFEAKISDLGVSRMMKNTDSACKMTRVPGTPDFMPPETFDEDPEYDTAVDIFSYGGIMLCTLVEEWPTPTAREKVALGDRERKIISEVERRQKYLNKIKESGELKLLIIKCLNDDPKWRPAIPEVSNTIERFKEASGTYGRFNDPLLPISSTVTIQQVSLRNIKYRSISICFIVDLSRDSSYKCCVPNKKQKNLCIAIYCSYVFTYISGIYIQVRI